MRGVNKVWISGNLCSDGLFNTLKDGREVCSFKVASERRNGPDKVLAVIRVNVYNENLTRICKKFVRKGGYVQVEGELMNRPGKYEELTEVRAKEVIFVDKEEDNDSSY